jgi:hypothetical protein
MGGGGFGADRDGVYEVAGVAAWPKENRACAGVATLMRGHSNGHFRQANHVKKQGVQLLRTFALTLKMALHVAPSFCWLIIFHRLSL